MDSGRTPAGAGNERRVVFGRNDGQPFFFSTKKNLVFMSCSPALLLTSSFDIHFRLVKWRESGADCLTIGPSLRHNKFCSFLYLIPPTRQFGNAFLLENLKNNANCNLSISLRVVKTKNFWHLVIFTMICWSTMGFSSRNTQKMMQGFVTSVGNCELLSC